MKEFISIILISVLLNGCATITGPLVSQQEIIEAQEQLRVKALGYQLKQLERVNNIGYQLISHIPREEIKITKEPQPYLGIYAAEINKYLKQLYNLNTDKGMVVIVVIDGSPAKTTGIMPGDVLVSIDNNRVSSRDDFNAYSRKLNIGDSIRLQIERDGVLKEILLSVGSIFINVPITMVDVQEVNAAAGSSIIYVTYGLMNFAKSDDEIAAVLAHELAHLVRGHVAKAQVSSLLSFLIALPLGIAADKAAPGTGNLVMRTTDLFTAGYSRDLEREADYFSVKFTYFAGFDPYACANVQERFAIEIPRSMIRNYLSTHPSSPERMLRIKKTIEELKSQKFQSSS